MLGTGELDPPTANIVPGGQDSKKAEVSDMEVTRRGIKRFMAIVIGRVRVLLL